MNRQCKNEHRPTPKSVEQVEAGGSASPRSYDGRANLGAKPLSRVAKDCVMCDPATTKMNMDGPMKHPGTAPMR